MCIQVVGLRQLGNIGKSQNCFRAQNNMPSVPFKNKFLAPVH